MTRITPLWVPCYACEWSYQMGLLFNENTKQQPNLHTRVTYYYPSWLLGCSAWGTEPNSAQQLWYVGIHYLD